MATSDLPIADPDADGDAAEGVIDASRTAVEAACKNRHPLLDFEEYLEVGL